VIGNPSHFPEVPNADTQLGNFIPGTIISNGQVDGSNSNIPQVDGITVKIIEHLVIDGQNIPIIRVNADKVPKPPENFTIERSK
jgi:hypothetical protein